MVKKKPTPAQLEDIKKKEEKNEIRQDMEERRQDMEERRQDNLCLTFEDINDDAQKTTTRTVPTGDLFRAGLIHLTGMENGCPYSFSNDIKRFISQQTAGMRKNFRQKNPPVFHSIPFGGGGDGDRDRDRDIQFLHAVVSSNPRELLISFDRENVVIPQETLALRQLVDQNFTEEMLKNEIEEAECGGFRTFIRDNSDTGGVLPESSNISSLYDDGARSIKCGTRTLAGWLTDKYGYSWSLDLFNAGLTSIRGSSLSAQWLAGAPTQFPAGAIGINGHERHTFVVLTDNQVLFTLNLGGNYVGCIFTFPLTHTGGANGNVYSNAGLGASKTPVFYYFVTNPLGLGIDPGSIIAFIIACFSGNPPKNSWFNANNGNYTIAIYTLFAALAQLGKATGDGSFASTCKYDELFASNDAAACARALLQYKSVAYRSYDGLVLRENIYTVIVPIRKRPQAELKKIAKKANIKPRREKRKYKVKIIKILAAKIIQRKSGRQKKKPERLTYSFGGTLPNIATDAATDAPTLPDAIIAPVTLLPPDADVTNAPPKPQDNGDNGDNGDNEDDDDDDTEDDEDDAKDADYEPAYGSIDYLFILLQYKISQFKAFSEFLKSVIEQLTKIKNNTTTTYTLDGLQIKVNPKTFNVEKKILTIEAVNKFIEKFIETPIDSLGKVFITSYIKTREIPSYTGLVNKFSGLIEYDLFVINENTNFLSSLPCYYFIDGFYNLYLFLMEGSYTDESKVTTKFSDDDIFAPLITAANAITGGNLNKYFADTDSKFTELSSTNAEVSNSIESIIKIVGNLILLVKDFFEKNTKYKSKKSYYESIISVINILRTKLGNGDIKKHQFYEELSFNLYILSSAININTLSFMIVHSIMIEYSGNRDYNDTLLSQCISNYLITITSTQGTSIFDLEIVITFVVSISYDSNRWSISYPEGFEGLYTLITIKKLIDGESLEFLNDNEFNLQKIGDFVDTLASHSEEKSLTDEEINKLVETSITEKYEQIEAFQKLQEKKSTSSLVDTRTLVSTVGGKNNRISNPKHNTKYRKNYKKFVSKYIIKKKKNNKKNNKNNKNNKNKTRKNKRLTKSTPNSKRNNKTLKNKKGKSKLKYNNHKSNHKSKYNNKTKTNYYNFYKHNKTLKH